MFGVINWDLSHSVGPTLAWLRLALVQQALGALKLDGQLQPLRGEVLKDLRPCGVGLLGQLRARQGSREW